MKPYLLFAFFSILGSSAVAHAQDLVATPLKDNTANAATVLSADGELKTKHKKQPKIDYSHANFWQQGSRFSGVKYEKPQRPQQPPQGAPGRSIN